MSKIIAAAALVMFSALVGPEEIASSDCLSGRREALIAGGFSGTVVCSGEDVTLSLSGTTGSDYTVYDYRYRIMAAAVMHGGQRILIFKGPEYIGQYALSPPPYSNVSVINSRVLVNTNDPFSEDAVLEFSNGPPPQVFIGGYVLDLYR